MPLAQGLHERLTKSDALAVFSSDALSSVAYATEEIMKVLGPGRRSAALSLTLPISLVIVGAARRSSRFSYRQTIRAYPSGGGATSSPARTSARCPG